tara:strand:+ start:43991 stop:46759 length:2769 start_codon:yes stop_codon:yes gene_type:complete
MKKNILLILLFTSIFSFAQNTGSIVGKLTDKEYNDEPLAFANVLIKGTIKGTTSDIDGLYGFDNLTPGSFTLIFSFVGYETHEIKVQVLAGKVTEVNVPMGASAASLDEIVITTTTRKESETALLLEQKNAVEMKQAIGAQELSRKGVSDAASAVTKTSGVSEQEGVKNVFVRGLGDRYNSTSLNGLPLPSEDPEYKNISLKFFSTDIIKSINVNKTFTSSLYGDVDGANIDISSQDLNKLKTLSISFGSEINSNAINTNKFLVTDGQNYLGLLENGTGYPISDLNTYKFDTSFKPKKQENPVNTDFSLIAGRKFNVGENNSLSVFGVVIFSNSYTYSQGKTGAVNAIGQIGLDLDFKKYKYQTSQSGLANVKYKFGSGNSITYNGLLIHDDNSTVGDYVGFKPGINDNNNATKSFIRRQQVNDNVLFSNQLIINYKIFEKLDSNIGLSYNKINASEPDRRTNSYDFQEAKNRYVVATNSSSLNNRFFSTLKEDDLTGKIDLVYSLNPEEELVTKFAFGGNYRKTDRTFNFTQFNFDFPLNTNFIEIDDPDAVFNQTFVNNGAFTIETSRGFGANAFDPFFYTGKRDIIAGYLQITYPLSEKFTLQVGVRNENVKQKVEWDTNLSSSSTPTIGPSELNKNYILPSLTTKYSFSEKSVLRFAASQTYTYPQFKETAPFLYEDVNFTSFGNPDLIPSTNYNFDLKYDFYLSKSEIISLGAFYKLIKDPINRISVAAASNDLSYANLGDAFATGLEIEARKTIFNHIGETKNNSLAFGLNASYLYTKVKNIDSPNDRITILFTNPNSKLEGASPLLINSDLSYIFSNKSVSLTSSLVFNYFYDKVFSIGISDSENIVEKAIPTLDFVNKFEIIKNKIGINISFKNILNPNFKLTQETTNANVTKESVVSSYKKGYFASVGVFWNL